MSTIITAAEVYSSVDTERAVAEVTRVGGGAYQFRSFDGLHSEKLADFASAIAAAEKYAVFLATPAGRNATTAQAAALAQELESLKASHAAEIEDLKAQLASG